MVLLQIVAFVFVLGLIILIHEWGHFYFAKKAGVLCHEFSFGMGPLLWQTQKGETKYSIRAIPIGGYVMMAGEDQDTSLIKQGDQVRLVLKNNIVEKIVVSLKNKDYQHLPIVTVLHQDLYGERGDLFIEVEQDDEATTYPVKRDGSYVMKKEEMQFSPYERSMESKSMKERFMAVFAGPMMNFILAITVFFILGLFVGTPDTESPILGDVVPDYPAEAAGLTPGSMIVSINEFDIESWNDISEALAESKSYTVVYSKDNELFEETIVPKYYFYGAGFASDFTFIDQLIITGVSEDTLAGKAGMLEGDELIKIDGTAVTTWAEVAAILEANTTGEEVQFTVIRDGEEVVITETPYGLDVVETQGVSLVETQIGIAPEHHFSLTYAVKYAFIGTWNSVESIRDTLHLLFSSNQVGVDDLAGPVGIYSITSRMISGGLLSLLGWIGLLSVNIGVLNLLPIPALDGGRIVFLSIEALTRQKVSRNIENRIHTAMYFVLLALLAYVTWNDILRLFHLK